MKEPSEKGFPGDVPPGGSPSPSVYEEFGRRAAAAVERQQRKRAEEMFRRLDRTITRLSRRVDLYVWECRHS